MKLIFMIVLGVIASLFPIQPEIKSEAIQQVLIRMDFATLNKITARIPNVDQSLAIEVINQAEELAYNDFPKKNDILSVIAIESTFKQGVTDGKGSCGLMQVNAKANSLDSNVVCSLPLTNMVHGVKILRENYVKLKSEKKALLAYNSGLGNFLKGNYNLAYYNGFMAWRSRLS